MIVLGRSWRVTVGWQAVLVAKIGGIESTAKIRSVDSITARASGYALRTPDVA
jgi:hypothetical protein